MFYIACVKINQCIYFETQNDVKNEKKILVICGKLKFNCQYICL